MATQPPPPNLDEYSPSATLIPFDNPIPLLRGPIPTDPLDDPTSGPYLLAFKDPQSWSKAYRACATQITQQCDSGARIGCSITASNKCKTPWWKSVLGLSKRDFEERARCEELEMQACTTAAQERCREFAKDKCLPAFRDARIELGNGLYPPAKVNWKNAARVISWVCFRGKIEGVEELMWAEVGTSWAKLKAHSKMSYCRGSDLIDSGLIK